MKKALVVTKEFSGRSVGHIEDLADSSNIDKRSGYLYEKMAKVVVPESLESFPKEMLKAVKPLMGDEKAEFWFKDDDIVPVDPEDDSYLYQPAEEVDQWNIVIDLEKFKAEEIKKEYISLTEAVYAEMESVFGTKSADSASADEATYRLWLEDPAFYAGEGFLAKVSTASYVKGDVLDTEAEISGYATEMLAKIKNYAKWRKQKQRDFSLKKASIENA